MEDDPPEVDNSKPLASSFSIHDACEITAIEPSRIRFIEQEFKEFFPGLTHGAGFNQAELDLMGEIHERIFRKGERPDDVRRELRGKREGFRTIAVTSGKGGVGKTTVSINLAIALSRAGRRVLLCDADMGLGNVHVFAGISPRGTLMDLLEGKAAAEQILSPGPDGMQVLCNASGSSRLAEIDPRALERLLRELERIGKSFDILLIDTGAGISPHVTQFLAAADDIVIVTTPNIASTLDAYGVIKVSREARMRGRLHVVVNQAEDEKQSQAVYEKISGCAERFLGGRPSNLGWLARDPAVEEANQARTPLLSSRPEHPNARKLQQMAGALSAAGAPSRAAA